FLALPATTDIYTLSLHDALPIWRAVYALVLRTDAIPHDLPDDLAQQLKVWDLPEFEDPYEDARYGHLTDAADAAVLSGEPAVVRSEEHTSELQSRENLVCRLLLE